MGDFSFVFLLISESLCPYNKDTDNKDRSKVSGSHSVQKSDPKTVIGFMKTPQHVENIAILASSFGRIDPGR